MHRIQAFTLIELLVVISIVAVLAGMLLPAIGAVRDQARASQCSGNFRQIGMGVMMYGDEWEGQMPPNLIESVVCNVHPELNVPAGKSLAWCDEDRVGGYLDGAVTQGGYFTPWGYFPPYHCPTDRRVPGSVAGGSVSYGMNHRLFNTALNEAQLPSAWRSKPMSVWRRTSQLAIAADTQRTRWFCQSSDVTTVPPVFYYSDQSKPTAWGPDYQNPDHMYARHRGGANFLFGDGHIEFSKTMPEEVQAKRVFVRMDDM